MTEHTEWNDETLMAWADGELSADRVALLEAAMLSDEGLAERAALMMETRALTQAAWDLELQAPVPDALRASVEAMVVKDRAARQAAQAPEVAATASVEPRRATMPKGPTLGERVRDWVGSWFSPWPAALAASVLCAGLGFMLGNAQQGMAPVQLADASAVQVGKALSVPVAQALSQVGSGSTQTLADGSQLVPVATYQRAEGGLCREFSLASPQAARVEAVACLQGATWQVFAAAQALEDSGYAAAEAHSALRPVLEQLQAGAAMPPEAEQAALQGLQSR